MHASLFLLMSVILFFAGVLLADPPAKPAKVEIIQKWSGTIQEAPFHTAVVVDAEAFAEVWNRLGVPGKTPDLDFTRHIVLAAAIRTSGLYIWPSLDASGDLKTGIVATPDQPAFISYALAVIPRPGIKTVDGNPLESRILILPKGGKKIKH
jgi:hypothetical protein